MNEWTIYWIMRLDKIRDLFSPMFYINLIITIILCYLLLFAWLEDEYKNLRIIFKMWIYSAFILFLSNIITTFIPTTKEMLLIKSVSAIVNNKEAGKFRVALNKLLDEYLKDKGDKK